MSGKVIKSGDSFYNRLKTLFDNEVIQQTNNMIILINSALGDKTVAKGAVSLILNDILNLKV